MTTSRTAGNKKILGWKEILLALFLVFTAWGAGELFTGSPAGFRRDTEGDIQVLLTSPRYPDAASQHYGGLDEQLAEAIDGARKSVDVAAYDFDLERVIDALVRAHRRDVRVRLVTDTDYAHRSGPVRLQEEGIPVVFDAQEPFMHHKFVVIDEQIVWTGSWNLTVPGTYRNNNNVVVLRSESLARNYTVEFEEMFEEGAFGASSTPKTPYPQVEVGEVLVENFFAPEEPVARRLVELLEEAETSIRLMAFVITDDDIARALLRKHREGVLVQGVVEARNANVMGSDVEELQRAGVELLLDGNPYNMHHKVIVIDEAIVFTGSYNFSRNASMNNDENVLIIHSREVAASYVGEFQRVYRQAKEAQ